MFRRPRRPFPRRSIVRNLQQARFENAFRMEGKQSPQESAQLFSELAEQKAQEKRYRQAANLHAQAAHRWLDAGEFQKSREQANLALKLFEKMGMQQRTKEFSLRYAVHKKNPGKPQPITENALSPEINQPKHLPATCSHCGAPIRSTEIEWIDSASAECGYCGIVIQTQE
ncbi:MAG: hypothetical protein JEZ00_15390 [Anaerolineaceae bacterium]|nr:hypothetical protein [Anaerolineaceae bacterium]